MLTGKFADTFAVLRRFDILIRYKMIEHQRDFILIKDTVCLHLFHFMNSNRGSNVVPKH